MLKWLFIAGAVAWYWRLPRTNTPLVKRGESGVASWYGPGYYGNKTANGETFTAREMTAAHKTLPFNTRVRVTEEASGNSVVVRINDRGPYVAGRIIDLSERAAEELHMKQMGIAYVTVEVLS
jgi:rare lipoprotein A